MRTKTISISDKTFTIEYPSARVFTRSPYCFVRVTTSSPGASNIKLIIGDVTLNRFLRETGASDWEVVFPLSDIFEYQSSNNYTNKSIIIEYNGYQSNIGEVVALVGISDSEIKDASAQKTGTVPLYPNFPGDKTDVSQELLFPMPSTPSRVQLVMGSTITVYMGKKDSVVSIYPFSGFSYPSYNDNSEVSMRYTISGATQIISIPVFVDLCGNGVFVRWINEQGLSRVFRWDVEKRVDQYSNENSAVIFDSSRIDSYNFYRADQKKHIKKYLLHSGVVPRELAEVAKSLMAGRNIEYYDNELSRWNRCRVLEGDVEDNMNNMQDVVVELVSGEEVLPW